MVSWFVVVLFVFVWAREKERESEFDHFTSYYVIIRGREEAEEAKLVLGISVDLPGDLIHERKKRQSGG